eukprot:gnl/Hemi2/2613_TR928_c0_g1_i1.p1 gnl/Hemi2/2613_TR928_c0_g1~~gnl/Hemi2/2613_TR928_c0_g1_i1.p1  ORF type:complete len:330 (-),score=21.64 gnl/Hemi2/2613_TR928_c0_g1_i1:86-1075(-)
MVKLATLVDGTRDGSLIVVSRDGQRYASAAHIAPCLQAALDNWERVLPSLQQLYAQVLAQSVDTLALDVTRLHSPLPRAFEWIDGSAYINHIVLVRKARGAEPPATLRTDPLVYQGGSGVFLRPTEDIAHAKEEWGIDFEAEVCVITDDVPYATAVEDAERHIKLVMLCNDVSLRNLIPPELEKGFGFFVSKPATAFSPFAVTPDELGEHWHGCKLHLPMNVYHNNTLFGNPDAGGDHMHFSFARLISHVSQTRALTAGTIIGSGTVSNEDRSRGSCCLAEKRMIEKLETGQMTTPFMKFGDTVEITMFAPNSQEELFGRIMQRVVQRA